MHPIKTKNQIQTTGKIKSIFLIIGAILIFIAPLVHVNFQSKPSEVLNFENKIQKLQKDKIAKTITPRRENSLINI